MQHASRFIQLSALAFGIAGALTVGQAQASGFQLKENSVKAMGAAFAGAGVNETDSSVVANNPATMARFSGTTMQVDVTAIDLSYEFNGTGTDALGRPMTGGNGGDAGTAAMSPGSPPLPPVI